MYRYGLVFKVGVHHPLLRRGGGSGNTCLALFHDCYRHYDYDYDYDHDHDYDYELYYHHHYSPPAPLRARHTGRCPSSRSAWGRRAISPAGAGPFSPAGAGLTCLVPRGTPPTPPSGMYKIFIGWCNNHFNNLHFKLSLGNKHKNMFKTHKVC